MKNVSRITQSLIVAALCSTGVAMAQSSTASPSQPTSPSNTPNDTTGTQPNTPQQPGTMPPAPSQSTTPMQPGTTTPGTTTPGSTAPGTTAPHTGQTDDTHGDGRGKAPSDPGNTNVSPTQNMQGGSAPYTPSQSGQQ